MDLQSEYEFELNTLSPVEVAEELSSCFTQEQAEMIAQHVYQPLREALAKILKELGISEGE